MRDEEAVVRRLYESAFDPSVIRDVVADDLVYHLPDGSIGGRDALIGGSNAVRSAFSDLTFDIDELSVQGNEVTVTWTMHGTHRGAFAGIAPTGKRVSMSGRHVERVEGGIIVERSGQSDHAALMRQLTS